MHLSILLNDTVLSSKRFRLYINKKLSLIKLNNTFNSIKSFMNHHFYQTGWFLYEIFFIDEMENGTYFVKNLNQSLVLLYWFLNQKSKTKLRKKSNPWSNHYKPIHNLKNCTFTILITSLHITVHHIDSLFLDKCQLSSLPNQITKLLPTSNL